ncbi:MAG: hypothetical protein PHN94_08095, partial [Bacteroidales bacterium]|nr:hypothetical protein [Bacteroidales bacterium]
LGFFWFLGFSLTCGIYGWNTPITPISLGLLFCAGFFAGLSLFVLRILWDLIKSPDNQTENSLR